jgi:hypothetical protein
VDDHGIFHRAVVFLREPVHVGVNLRSVVPIRLGKAIKPRLSTSQSPPSDITVICFFVTVQSCDLGPHLESR